MARRRSFSGMRYRCIICGAGIVVRSALAPSYQVCPNCARASEGSWRTLYDREQGIGEIPQNLKARLTTNEK